MKQSDSSGGFLLWTNSAFAFAMNGLLVFQLKITTKTEFYYF